MKETFYHELAMQLRALIGDESDKLAVLSNASACLNDALTDINWVGFYLYKNGELVLGPFQGKVACTHIPLGKGVCGTAALSGHIQRVSLNRFDECDEKGLKQIAEIITEFGF